jgi:hypothetical protein
MTSVDHDLFENLAEAIEFVVERGGGIVYSDLAGTQFVKAMKIPDGVEVKPTAERPLAELQILGQ